MRSRWTTPFILDPRFHVGPMEQLYELVLGLVETRYDTDTRDLLAGWLHSARPTLAHMAVMITEMALSGTPMGDKRLSLIGFKPDGEPLVAFDHATHDIHYPPASYWTRAGNGGPGACRRSGNVVTFTIRRRPFFDLGREFLPTHERDEVEIALVSLPSVTGDLISIRARPSGTGIAYRIEDEYGTNFRFYPKHSAQPRSLGEPIAMIDYATGHLDGNREGLTNAYRDYNLDGSDGGDLVDFVTVTSDFYPALQAYYQDEARAWLARVGAQRTTSMQRALMTDRRWRHILRVVDETFEDYLTGLVPLRHGVVADLKRKLADGRVCERRPRLEQRASRGSRASAAARHPGPRARP